MNTHSKILNCVAIDIGYGAVKLIHGQFAPVNREPLSLKEKILPIGAGPEGLVAVDPGRQVSPVLVNGERWIAGVSPMALQSAHARQLHEEYPASSEYLALFLSAIGSLGIDHIDVLVTGLPTSQAVNLDLQARLEARLTGKHPVNESTVVQVHQTVVLPQPLGAYQDLLTHQPQLAKRDGQYLLVVDPGFFSLDWLVMMGRRPLFRHSHSSTDGWSRVLEMTCGRIRELVPGIKVSINRLDETIRMNRIHNFHLGRAGYIDLEPLLREFGTAVCKNAIVGIKNTLRGLNDEVQSILLCGGSADYYKAAIEAEFPKADVFMAEKPQFANVRGYLRFGVNHLMNSVQAAA